MKLNIENCANNGEQGVKAWALDELVRNLKEMRDRSNAGDMQAAVTEFFEVFCFNDGQGVAATTAPAPTEPVAWMDDFGNAFPLGANKFAGSWMDDHKRTWKPLYTTPTDVAPRNSKPLTPAQRRELIDRAGDITDGLNQDDFADEIVKLTEQAHGIRATPPSAVEAAQPEAVGWLWQYRPKHPKTGEVVGPWMSFQDAERARACGYEVRQVRECRACDGEGWTEQGDPEIGSAKFDCPTCNGDGCFAAAPTTEATSSSDAERLDAARYQWLKNYANTIHEEIWGFGCPAILNSPEAEMRLDAAIDAAIANKGGKL